ncbi:MULTISPECIES: DUF4267 domain-containing protein [Streptomyces]|uniref:DUF4267 domain-containing protein n=1 Tax=Streptomyces lasiicapitis TaxID=1923961 RepID=A0ABQ2MMT9_9ACTN|nr:MULTISPECIES: DUF4267 domain-containing protein [Streptomyces]QIB47760.1 DUF4267 domain-containing protein [Streptomyces aureoverticillatus]GGO54557.1 hypothetical protein GCM10012286_64600 [Streptomyces lasiicapitis]
MTTRVPFPRDPAGSAFPLGGSAKRRHITTALAALSGATVLFFGLNFLLNPDGAPSGFGITPWPEGNADGYFAVKGVRDIAVAATVFLLLTIGQRRTLGWVVLIDAIIPLGDALTVLTHGGTYTTALSIHVSAAALVVLTAIMLLTESGQRPPERTHLTPSP